jgi:hypothetical protein
LKEERRKKKEEKRRKTKKKWMKANDRYEDIEIAHLSETEKY